MITLGASPSELPSSGGSKVEGSRSVVCGGVAAVVDADADVDEGGAGKQSVQAGALVAVLAMDAGMVCSDMVM